MPSWNRNEPLAEKRRVTLAIYDVDGAPMSALFLTDGTSYTFLVDKADGHFVAAAASLQNTDRPLVIADDVVDSVEPSDVALPVGNTLTLSSHGLLTGDGPIRFTNSGGALPGGISSATDYWVIRYDDDTIQIATTRAFALAGTAIDITSAGTGTHTLVDTATTTRLVDGIFIYEATQAEINYRGTYFAIMVFGDTLRTLVHNVDLHDEQQLHAGTAQLGTTDTITLDAGASATNDLYRNCTCLIVGGTGIGQSNTIASYVGSTKVATMAEGWGVTPDNTSQFVLVPGPVSANPSSVATYVWAEVIEDSHTAEDLFRLMVGILAGAVADFTTGTYAFKSLNGAKTRATTTGDQTGRGNPTIGDLT